MKYLILEKCGFKFPVIFPDMVTHSSIAKAANHEHAAAISAGFVNILTFEVFGHSESLGIGPSPEDSFLIATMLRLGDSGLVLAGLDETSTLPLRIVRHPQSPQS